MTSVDDWRLTERLHAPAGKGDPFAAAVRATRMPMLITDPRQPDNPIVFANDAFLGLTGYTRDEVLGNNCRFLQGPDTDPQAVTTIRQAVQTQHDVNVDILNYRKDGTAFWNALYISPVTDEHGSLLFFFASQLDVTGRKQVELQAQAERARIEEAVQSRTRELEEALRSRTELLHEVEHRVKNNLQLISALILIELKRANGSVEQQALSTLKERIEALASVHRRLYRDGDISRFDVAAFVREFSSEALRTRAQREVALRLDLTEVQVAAPHAAPVALLVSEMVRVAIGYADAHAVNGVCFSIKEATNQRYRYCLEADDQGAALEGAVKDGSRTFIDMLARQLRARVFWNANGAANRICIDLPVDELQRGE